MKTIIKQINSLEDKELNYLSNCYISNFTGFGTNLIIMVNIRTSKDKDLLLVYILKSKFLYYKLRDYLKELVKYC